MEFVNGKDDIPYIMENKMFESTNQIWKVAASIVPVRYKQVIKYLKVQFDHQGEIAFHSACVNPLRGHYHNHHHRKHYIPLPPRALELK